ncbi:MAG: GAF domain-containing sensor histidine kinase [Pedobacter sp.]|nr:MAG: GAF domain-containing sensor histidine kinase [Pedobacter sp.]
MGFAAVARVTEDRWVACAVRDEINFGLLAGGELELKTTICHEIRQHQQTVVFDNASEDLIYANHHTPKMYGLKSYISMPIITKGGEFFGTLCAIDPNPASINNPETIGMFKLFAELIALHLSNNEELAISKEKLSEERQTAELRDKFIAILGHDLRNPVGAILNAAELLQRLPHDERVKKLSGIIKNSSYRMKGLIENILDFAKGHLGEGIKLDFDQPHDLKEMLLQVVAELQLIYPQQKIEVDFELDSSFRCDETRLAQLLSNLLSNALTHGYAAEPIKVMGKCDGSILVLSVSNKGDKIPQKVMDKLFQPFYRGAIEPQKQGLGLGLFIASEIAKAHNGILGVTSIGNDITFTLKISNSNS